MAEGQTVSGWCLPFERFRTQPDRKVSSHPCMGASRSCRLLAEPAPRGGTRPTKARSETVGPVPHRAPRDTDNVWMQSPCVRRDICPLKLLLPFLCSARVCRGKGNQCLDALLRGAGASHPTFSVTCHAQRGNGCPRTKLALSRL